MVSRRDSTTDDRGQLEPGPASIILGFFLLIITGAILWAFLDPAVSGTMSAANATTDYEVFNRHMGYNDQIWNHVLAVVLGIGLFGTIAFILSSTGGN